MKAAPTNSETPSSKRRWFQFSLRTLMIGVTLLAVACWVVFSGLPRGIMQWIHPLGENQFEMIRELADNHGGNISRGRFDMIFTVYANAPFEVDFRLSTVKDAKSPATRSFRSIAKATSSPQIGGYRSVLQCEVSCNNGLVHVYDAHGAVLGEMLLGQSFVSSNALVGDSRGALGAWYLLSTHSSQLSAATGSVPTVVGDQLEYAVFSLNTTPP